MAINISEDVPTVSLLETIGYPTDDGFVRSSAHTDDLLDCARNNKISNLYLWRLDQHDAVRESVGDVDADPNRRFEDLQRTVGRISDRFGDAGLDFALVKTPISFPADFSDVDVLVQQSDLAFAREVFRANGYEELADSPSSTDFEDPDTGVVLDVQNNFTLRELVYLSGEEVLERSEYRTEFDRTIRTPTDAAQLALIVIHSLTEQLFTLRDFYHIVFLFERMGWSQYRELRRITREYGLQGAMNATLPLVARLSTEVFGRTPETLRTAVQECSNYGEFSRFRGRELETPHRYATRSMLRMLVHKCRDPVFRSSIPDELGELRDPWIVKYNLEQLLYRQRRETY